MLIQILRSLKKQASILYKSTSGKEDIRPITPIATEVNYNMEWYGNKYGGFYVHPNLLTKESIVYSFGIGEDTSFDNAIIEKHKCKVFGFDPTPKSIRWVKKQKFPSEFLFFEFGIGLETGVTTFLLPKNRRNVSGSILNHKHVDEYNPISVPMKSFSDITTELSHQHIDILKMDIEGAEFDLIESILSSSVEIDQILLELHERFFDDGAYKVNKLLKTLKEYGYEIFAVSESFEEVSFLKTRISKTM